MGKSFVLAWVWILSGEAKKKKKKKGKGGGNCSERKVQVSDCVVQREKKEPMRGLNLGCQDTTMQHARTLQKTPQTSLLRDESLERRREKKRDISD